MELAGRANELSVVQDVTEERMELAGRAKELSK
jgi:hypothetical protein